MLLFDDYDRTDRKPKYFGESDYSFYNRVCNPEFDKIRKLLDKLFKN